MLNLNDKQMQAVATVNGPVLVIAGAGSGKTRALTYRIQNLIQKHAVSPQNILAITFTNKATNEMKERLNEIDPYGAMQISTFHALCAKILRKYIDHMPPFSKYFSIYNDDERTKLLKKIIAEFAIDIDGFLKSVAWHISNAKSLGLQAQEFEKEFAYEAHIKELARVYAAYEMQLQKNNALDFDDLLLKTYLLLNTNEHVLSELQNQYLYIHVDEFQDTNLIQYKILKLLAKKYQNIFVVGDEDQCIYGWRGASIENTNLYVEDFKPQIIKLEQNYRSTKQILNLANKLIVNNTSRIEKELWTQNEQGEDVKYYKAYSDQDEADRVVRDIYNKLNSGTPASEIAILFRMGALSRQFEERLLNYDIPYSIYGAFKFYERSEIRNVLAYLWMIYNSNDNESLKRIINWPKRGIGKTTVQKMETESVLHNVSMYYVLMHADQYNLTNSIINKLKQVQAIFAEIEAFVKDETNKLEDVLKFVLDIAQIKQQYNKHDEEDNNRLLNIGQLQESIENFAHNNPESTMIDFLQSVTLESQQETLHEDGEPGVTVSTIHAVKGLEFESVYVVGAEEGIFPISRAYGSEQDMEEERRLMYVAITRSKRHLMVSSADSRYLYNARNSMQPSRFLKEMELVKYAPANSHTFKDGYTSFKHASFASYKPNNGSEEVDNMTQGVHNYANKPVKIDNNLDKLMQAKLKKQAKNFDAFVVGTQVLHPKFGIGEIIKSNISSGNNSVDVKFGGFGVKCLNLEFAPLQILKKRA